jgi:diphosphomevalonate decarboxylase
LDTYPPIFYLNEFSKQVIEVVDHYINANSNLKVAYTFDAGPHAFLFVHEDNLKEIFSYLEKTFHIQAEQLNENAREIQKSCIE